MQASSSGANGPGQQLALPPEKYAPPPALPTPSTATEPHSPAALRQRLSPLVKRDAAIADGDRWGLLHHAKQSLRSIGAESMADVIMPHLIWCNWLSLCILSSML